MTPHILIVDDEPFMHRLIGASLQKGGFTLTFSRSGDEALAMATAQPPDLIIMDLMMQGKDGLATTREFKATPHLRPIPVIMLTSTGHKLTEEEAVQSGVECFLTKPFSPSRLLAEARRILAFQSTGGVA